MKAAYKEGYFWRDKSNPWHYKGHVCYPNGKGDLISNTMRKTLFEKDSSDWAYGALSCCKSLLKSRKRWPDYMNQPIDCKSKIYFYVRRWFYRKGLVKERPFRPQNDMTRDPHIMFFAVCCYLDHKEDIEDVTIPFRLFRPNVWAWRKYLITGKDKYRRRYYFWERFSINEPDFAQRLTKVMEELI